MNKEFFSKINTNINGIDRVIYDDRTNSLKIRVNGINADISYMMDSYSPVIQILLKLAIIPKSLYSTNDLNSIVFNIDTIKNNESELLSKIEAKIYELLEFTEIYHKMCDALDLDPIQDVHFIRDFYSNFLLFSTKHNKICAYFYDTPPNEVFILSEVKQRILDFLFNIENVIKEHKTEFYKLDKSNFNNIINFLTEYGDDLDEHLIKLRKICNKYQLQDKIKSLRSDVPIFNW